MPGWLLYMWAAFDAIDPIGGLRHDWHYAASHAREANRRRNTVLFPKPFHAVDFLMNFEAEAAAPRAVAPAEKKAKTPAELFAMSKRVAMLYNRDNERRRKREQERVERQRSGHRLGRRRTRHGR